MTAVEWHEFIDHENSYSRMKRALIQGAFLVTFANPSKKIMFLRQECF